MLGNFVPCRKFTDSIINFIGKADFLNHIIFACLIMVESTPANTAYEELLCLSIGVTQYEEHLNFETVPSASFDSIMVTNHFT